MIHLFLFSYKTVEFGQIPKQKFPFGYFTSGNCLMLKLVGNLFYKISKKYHSKSCLLMEKNIILCCVLLSKSYYAMARSSNG